MVEKPHREELAACHAAFHCRQHSSEQKYQTLCEKPAEKLFRPPNQFSHTPSTGSVVIAPGPDVMKCNLTGLARPGAFVGTQIPKEVHMNSQDAR